MNFKPTLSIMGYILLFLLLMALWWIVKPFVRIYRNVRRAQRGEWIDLNDLFGTPGAQQQQQHEEPRRNSSGWSGLRRKKKKIDSDIGEYIKFKEVPADPAAPSTPTGTEFVEEQQITDIEWEDIK